MQQILEFCAVHKIALIIAAVAVAVLAVIIGIIIGVHRHRNKDLYRFRLYKIYEGSAEKKAKHPKLIVEILKTKFGYMGLTESEKHGHSKNIVLTQNPVKGDTRKANLRKPVEYDVKENFEDILENYNLSKADLKVIKKYLKNRKRVKRENMKEQKRKERKWKKRNKKKK